ncbi:MAG TPA: L-seryl-tRNA(Sec) selenium transferase [Desulfuromonadales bacterium]|nr:L-seryl-tRNA(Sec) selenium transferase [Desulfuromonadales bacterium]
MPAGHEKLRRIPKVDLVMEWPEIQSLLGSFTRPVVIAAVRHVLEQLRGEIREGRQLNQPDDSAIAARILQEITLRSSPSLRRVINGSGVVIHTNLGRAPLAAEAIDAIVSVAAGYSNLEYDLDRGERGSRYSHVESLLCELTGAESALVVNNNAAAVILALSSLAPGREVVVSRGELVEIGGSFRIPDVMRQSGARLVEVGCTNRTHIRDYRAAIGDDTALLMKVHTSNFAIIGFTAEVSPAELAVLGRERKIAVLLDAGSGCLLDLSLYGISGEPTVRQHLSAGVDVVTFSGDKLLGGPQAGIIVGRKSFVDPMKRHPLLRALRIDKLCLAALEATLKLYRDERRALASVPVLQMLIVPERELIRRADGIIRRIRRHLPENVTLVRRQGESTSGGGSSPLVRLPTALIEVTIAGTPPHRLEEILRRSSPPLIGRIHRDRYVLDVRTLREEEITSLLASLQNAAMLLAEK